MALLTYNQVQFVCDNTFQTLEREEKATMSGNYPDGSEQTINKLYFPDRFGEDDRNEYIQAAEERLQEMMALMLEAMGTWNDENVTYEEDALWEGDIPYIYSLGIDRINRTIASRENDERWKNSPEIALLKSWSKTLKFLKDEYQEKQWKRVSAK
ncbi:MAG TPA: hypothetical protein PLI71_09960 [Clostridia bacterium]|nr:hypothetical protein [Clostridia bacterium]